MPFCYNHHIQISCIVHKHHAQPNVSTYLKVSIILYGRDLSGDSFRKLEEINKSEKHRKKAKKTEKNLVCKISENLLSRLHVYHSLN